MSKKDAVRAAKKSLRRSEEALEKIGAQAASAFALQGILRLQIARAEEDAPPGDEPMRPVVFGPES